MNTSASKSEAGAAAWARLQDDVRRQMETGDRRIQTCVDEYAGRGGRIFCDRGCLNCCTLTVNSSFTEALTAAQNLNAAQAAALNDYVERLRKLLPTVSDLKSYLRMQRQQLGDCPFLDGDGACSIYPVRPFSCRALLSTRPADWCGVDFGTLAAIEKELFMASLDRSAVDFPTHYLAASRQLGEELESAALLEMARTWGVSLSGNFPYLVWLEREFRLSETIPQGREATLALLEENGLNLPFVILVGD